jgi:hypothetical protein
VPRVEENCISALAYHLRLLGVDHAMQMRGCVFDVIMLVLAGPTFGAEDSAAVRILEIPVRELVVPFGLLVLFVIYSEVPFSVLGEPMFSN